MTILLASITWSERLVHIVAARSVDSHVRKAETIIGRFAVKICVDGLKDFILGMVILILAEIAVAVVDIIFVL